MSVITRNQMLDLGKGAAAELSRLRGEGWTAVNLSPDDTRGYPSVELTEAKSRARVKLIYGWHSTGKVTAVGEFPEGTGTRSNYRANIDPDRGAVVIGREVNRRVLEGGYLDSLPLMLERKEKQEASAARKAALLGRAAALFGVETETGDKVYVGKFARGSGYVEMYYGEGDNALNFSISGIPAETALAMLKVLADSNPVV
jgi:hypothetical protein